MHHGYFKKVHPNHKIPGAVLLITFCLPAGHTRSSIGDGQLSQICRNHSGAFHDCFLVVQTSIVSVPLSMN